MDSFEVLGISSSASETEIKSAYKKLAREHHPDKGGDPERFQEIQKAYESALNRPRPSFSTMFDDMINIVPKRRNRVEIKLTLEELFIGKSLMIQGVQIHLPMGIVPYQIIVVPELPEHQLLITVLKHPYFSFDPMTKNLVFKTSISLCEALIGYRGKIKHPNGKMLYITTPKNVVIGHETIFRCKHIGVPTGDSNGFSDLVVIFSLIMPKTIDSEKHRSHIMDIFECNVPLIEKRDDDIDVSLSA